MTADQPADPVAPDPAREFARWFLQQPVHRQVAFTRESMRRLRLAPAPQAEPLPTAEALAMAMEEDGWEFNGDPVLGAQSILDRIPRP